MSFEQAELGLSEVDRKKSRQAVYAYFKVYRRYKWLLSLGETPTAKRRAALPGYEDAAEPDRIRRSTVKPSSPMERSIDVVTKEDRMKMFCDQLDRVLNKLHPYQRDIIRHRFLGPLPDELPTDYTVWQTLRADGWYVGETYYGEQKREAVSLLAAALGVEMERF